MYMNTAPRPRAALLYVLRGQQRRATLPRPDGRGRGLGASVTINVPPAGSYQLPDLPTYADIVFTQHMNTAPRSRPALLYVLSGQRRRATLPMRYSRRRGFGDIVTGSVGNGGGLTATVKTADSYIADTLVTGQINSRPGQFEYTNDPAAMKAQLTSVMDQRCSLYPFSCQGQDINALVTAGVAQVMAARTSGVPSDTPGVTYYPTQNIACANGNVLIGGSCQPPGGGGGAPAPPQTYGSDYFPAPAYSFGLPVLAPSIGYGAPAAAPAAAATPAPAPAAALALTQSISIFGVAVPMWGALAAGFGALWLLGGKR